MFTLLGYVVLEGIHDEVTDVIIESPRGQCTQRSKFKFPEVSVLRRLLVLVIVVPPSETPSLSTSETILLLQLAKDRLPISVRVHEVLVILDA
jgi:hypothetical protein